ncbi:hypothetical protein MHU86_996 [Fragilaria crotonensis]|nr:hypothetical protein MHU86_996 [Fragilaria crotonensis]
MALNVSGGEVEPRVVSPYGNSGQAVVATLPLLAMFIYFLYEASVRPSEPIYALQGDDDVAIEEAWEETPPMIPLIDMIPVFLSFQGVFSILLVYLTVFIPRRRRLIRSYLEKGESSLGDVIYKESPPELCSLRSTQHAEVIYAYPNSTDWTIRKQVRVYQHYSRERVTVLRLLNRPFSGQPKSDLQIDLQSSRAAKPQVWALVVLSTVWVAFTFLAPIYILFQIQKLRHDDYEDFDKALKTYLIVGVGFIPPFAILGVYLRWSVYRHWLVNRGVLLKSQGNSAGGMGAQDEGVVGVFLSELVGVQHPEEISVGRSGVLPMAASTAWTGFSSTTSNSRWSNGAPDSIITT